MTLGNPTPHPGREAGAGAGAATGRRTAAPSRSLSCFTMPYAALEGGEADLRALLKAARRRCSDEKGQVCGIDKRRGAGRVGRSAGGRGGGMRAGCKQRRSCVPLPLCDGCPLLA